VKALLTLLAVLLLVGIATPAHAERTPTLQEQESCARQALIQVRLEGWTKADHVMITNHYNTRLDKCFVRISQGLRTNLSGRGVNLSVEVDDAFEGTEIADEYFHTDTPNGSWHRMLCKVDLPSGETKVCGSQDEFDALVLEYYGVR
jgi:hypothetical protein